MQKTTIAVFPIPNCVTFPSTVFPLHVFEPRYRTMIQYCLDNDVPLAIAHTEKEISPSKPNQPLAEALQTNQATYKPQTIVSAGRCQLLKTLDDGRLYVNVHLEKRYQLLTEVQTLPFSLYECDDYEDNSSTDDELADAELVRQKLLHRLSALTATMPEVNELLASPDWQQKSALESSFAFFGLLQLPPDISQPILEMRSPLKRLSTLLAILNQQD